MNFRFPEHHYVDRETGCVLRERPFGDWIVNHLYCEQREEPSRLYRLLTSRWLSSALGWASYDFPLGQKLSGIKRFMKRCAINLDECVDTPEALNTARQVFERKIRYWQCRPMSENASDIACPADSRLLLGSLKESSSLFLKGKLFEYEELLGSNKGHWLNAFRAGDFVICRLTPDKYHYNHTPVAGVVREFYTTDGTYHSCNPGTALTVANPYSKNKRTITIIDTDVAGGTGVGLIAMIEIVALMIGDIVQCYSRVEYQNPQSIEEGIFLERGCPKSLFRPGSSTTVLLFQEGRVEFSCDLIRNRYRNDIDSRYSQSLGRPVVETDTKVRSTIGTRVS
jgi:phosphatidylserine decarboxylase